MLGIGGFSKVYLVEKTDNNELFALKYIKLDAERVKSREEKYRRQIMIERDILVSLDHPFIVKLKYAFQRGRRFYFVMPFLQGGELFAYIKREKNSCRKEKL